MWFPVLVFITCNCCNFQTFLLISYTSKNRWVVDKHSSFMRTVGFLQILKLWLFGLSLNFIALKPNKRTDRFYLKFYNCYLHSIVIRCLFIYLMYFIIFWLKIQIMLRVCNYTAMKLKLTLIRQLNSAKLTYFHRIVFYSINRRLLVYFWRVCSSQDTSIMYASV